MDLHLGWAFHADTIPKYVLPPIKNTRRPHKKMKNINLPLQFANTGSCLELEPKVPLNDSNGSNNITYGLKLCQNVKDEDASDAKLVLIEQLIYDAKFEEKSGPSRGGFWSCNDGWIWVEDRKGICKNTKEDVKVKEYKRWTAKESLGLDLDKSKVVDMKAKVKEIVKIDNGGDIFSVLGSNCNCGTCVGWL
ncbi:hypothetical protein YC2023_108917 [Brassica napus]